MCAREPLYFQRVKPIWTLQQLWNAEAIFSGFYFIFISHDRAVEIKLFYFIFFLFYFTCASRFIDMLNDVGMSFDTYNPFKYEILKYYCLRSRIQMFIEISRSMCKIV